MRVVLFLNVKAAAVLVVVICKMKTNELIELLKKVDPNNECDICVDNHPVSNAYKTEYYYDGRLESVERDANWHPIRGGYPDDGFKVYIKYDTLEDALRDNPDMELDLSGITYEGKVNQRYKECIDEWIKEGRRFQVWKEQLEENHKNNLPPPPFLLRRELWQHKLKTWLKKLKLIT